MALDWIKMRTDLDTDPRVQKITEILSLSDSDVTVGKLHHVWSYFDRHSIDGRIPLLTASSLDRMLNAPGFAEAMASVNWLEIGDNGLTVPRFEEHNSKSAKRRAQDALRKAGERYSSVDERPSACRAPTGSEDPKIGRIGLDRPPHKEGGSSAAGPRRRPESKQPSHNLGQRLDRASTDSGRRADLDENQTTPRSDENQIQRSTNVRIGKSEEVSAHASLDDVTFEALYGRIREVTGEQDSFPTRMLYRYYGELSLAIIERALSATRDKINSSGQKVTKPGAYFNTTCRRIAQELGFDLTARRAS